jgi:hypothetical protein
MHRGMARQRSDRLVYVVGANTFHTHVAYDMAGSYRFIGLKTCVLDYRHFCGPIAHLRRINEASATVPGRAVYGACADNNGTGVVTYIR